MPVMRAVTVMSDACDESSDCDERGSYGCMVNAVPLAKKLRVVIIMGAVIVRMIVSLQAQAATCLSGGPRSTGAFVPERTPAIHQTITHGLIGNPRNDHRASVES